MRMNQLLYTALIVTPRRIAPMGRRCPTTNSFCDGSISMQRTTAQLPASSLHASINTFLCSAKVANDRSHK